MTGTTTLITYSAFILLLALNSASPLIILIIMESLVVMSALYVGVSPGATGSSLIILLILLIITAVTSTIGVSLLVATSRSHLKDSFNTLSALW